MTRSIRLLLAALATALALAVPAAAAYAGEDDNHHPPPRAGAACVPDAKVGDERTIETRNGAQTYRCEQRPGDPCPVWHWMYDPDVPRGQKTPTRCPECPSSPSSVTSPPQSSPPASTPSSTSSAPPASASATPSPSPGNHLPVTGARPWHIAGVALLIIIVGAGLVLAARRPRRTS